MGSVSSSFCPSLASPVPEVKYPRGIINPNYPGFQHLAHTLAEHFVDHQFDQSDSDVSEFEVELKSSADSDNGNNNNDTDLDKIEEILRGVFKSKESPSIESNGKFDGVAFCRNDLNEMNDKCDVINFSNGIPSMNDDLKVIIGDPKRMCTTPDILIKSSSYEEHIDFAEINEKPDILKNVFASDAVDGDQKMVANEKCESLDQIDKCEHGQWSITPIDIVGNFEQEVEREFGLIWSSSSDDEMCVAAKNQVEEISQDKTNSMYDKVSDNICIVSDNSSKQIVNLSGHLVHLKVVLASMMNRGIFRSSRSVEFNTFNKKKE